MEGLEQLLTAYDVLESYFTVSTLFDLIRLFVLGVCRPMLLLILASYHYIGN